jgi:hypothetical protein
MTRRLRVKVNMSALTKHLSREEGRAVPEAEVIQWLTDANFTLAGDAWIVAEPDLGHLDPSEVTWIEPLSDQADDH